MRLTPTFCRMGRAALEWSQADPFYALPALADGRIAVAVVVTPAVAELLAAATSPAIEARVLTGAWPEAAA